MKGHRNVHSKYENEGNDDGDDEVDGNSEDDEKWDFRLVIIICQQTEMMKEGLQCVANLRKFVRRRGPVEEGYEKTMRALATLCTKCDTLARCYAGHVVEPLCVVVRDVGMLLGTRVWALTAHGSVC